MMAAAPYRVDPPRVVRPQPGPQEAILSSPADIVIAGGSAGCGKSWSLLLECIRHHRVPGFTAAIFRRTYPRLTMPGGLWEESQGLYRPLGAVPKETTLEWAFPSGASIKLAHMQHATDRFAWHGAQVTLLCWDELQEFEEAQWWYLLSRNRSVCGVRPYVRGTCIPVPEDDRTGGWLHRLLAWWIGEDGLPVRARSGVVRWFARIEDELVWGENRAALAAKYPGCEPKSFTFIPGRLEDNPALLTKDPGYRANLLALPLVERERLLGGNWNVRPTAGKVFHRFWFEIVEAAPAEAVRVRYWDKAGTDQAGDYSAGVRMAKANGLYFVEDVQWGQWSSRDRNAVMRQTARLDGLDIPIWIEQEPGSGGKESAELSIQDLAGWAVRVEPVTGNKVTRAGPLSAQAEAGNVKLVAGAWNAAWLDEAHAFPDGRYDDQVDASAGAFNKLALEGRTVIGILDESFHVEHSPVIVHG